MKNIMIVGAGQLGSRHLQALASVKESKQIYVVDPSEESLKVAEERWNEVCPEEKVNFSTEVPSLESPLDFAVIATSAKYRLSALKNLVSNNKVKSLVLEKVLFQEKKEYHEAEELLIKNNIKAWVNCPRRMFEFYKNLKEELSDQKIISARVFGTDWGMACNGIHYVDLFSFLSNEPVQKVEVSNVGSTEESKRPGYYEVFGQLDARFETFSLQLQCLKGSEALLKVQIELEDGSVEIDELSLKYKKNINGVLSEGEYQILYQSQLSNVVYDDVQKNQCQLTNFQDSMSMHIKLLEPLVSIFKESGLMNNNSCPIT